MITTGADGIKDVMPPLGDADVESLTAGDRVRITGVLYTARDAAHARLLPLIDAGQPLPVDVRGQIIYYTGPSPARPGEIVGSIGPITTAALQQHGVEPDLQPEHPKIGHLVAEIARQATALLERKRRG